MCLYQEMGYDQGGTIDDLFNPLPNPGFPPDLASQGNQTQTEANVIAFPCPMCDRDSFTCGCYGKEDNDE